MASRCKRFWFGGERSDAGRMAEWEIVASPVTSTFSGIMGRSGIANKKSCDSNLGASAAGPDRWSIFGNGMYALFGAKVLNSYAATRDVLLGNLLEWNSSRQGGTCRQALP